MLIRTFQNSLMVVNQSTMSHLRWFGVSFNLSMVYLLQTQTNLWLIVKTTSKLLSRISLLTTKTSHMLIKKASTNIQIWVKRSSLSISIWTRYRKNNTVQPLVNQSRRKDLYKIYQLSGIGDNSIKFHQLRTKVAVEVAGLSQLLVLLRLILWLSMDPSIVWLSNS